MMAIEKMIKIKRKEKEKPSNNSKKNKYVEKPIIVCFDLSGI